MTEETNAAAPQTFKVYVGGLSAETTKESLTSAFSPAGTVVDAAIVNGRRGTFGFVDFTSKEQADKAVATLNGTALNGATVTVELSTGGRRRRPRRQPEGEAGDAEGAPRRRRRQPRGEGEEPRRRRRGPRRAREGAPKEGEEKAAAPATSEERAPRRKPRAEGEAKKPTEGQAEGDATRRRRRAPRRAEGEETAEEGQRQPRRRRTRRPRPADFDSRPDSSTGLFIANLPFSMDDASLKALFASYNVASAHVIALRSGRSRGYGFVELADASLQAKAIAEMNDKEVDSRRLVVKASKVQPEPAATPAASA